LQLPSNTVIIDHGAGAYTVYGHLDTVLVHEGDSVSRSDKVSDHAVLNYACPHSDNLQYDSQVADAHGYLDIRTLAWNIVNRISKSRCFLSSSGSELFPKISADSQHLSASVANMEIFRAVRSASECTASASVACTGRSESNRNALLLLLPSFYGQGS
jgi:hypothetical protein